MIGCGAYGGSDRVIVRRRIEENKLAELKTVVSQNCHLGSIAAWEESSTKLMSNKFEQRKKFELEKQKKLDLEIRKKKLKKLLILDEIKYKKEIDSAQETQSERRARLELQAKELRIKRIARRKDFLEKQRLKQFRNSCDELRLNHGQNLTMECHRIRNKQIKENKLKKQYEKTLDNKYLVQWKNELQKKIDRENKESEYKKNLNYETAKEIKKQIEENKNKQEEIKLNKENEIKQRIEKLKNDCELEQMNNLQKLKNLEIKRAEMQKEYFEFSKNKKEKQYREKELDKEFVRKMMMNQDKENNQKQEKNIGNKKDIQNYLLYLEKLKETKEENEKILAQLREQELEKEWQKREIRWKKEEFARKQLLENVIQTREDQIAYKECMQEKKEKENLFQTQKILKKLKQLENNENETKLNKLKYNKEIQQFLKKQINERKNEFDSEPAHCDDEDNKMYQQLLKQETEKDKISLQQGKSTHHYPKTTANWWTF